MLIFPLYVYSVCNFSYQFVCLLAKKYEFNMDSTWSLTEVCWTICSRPPYADMCQYNQHAEQSSDDFVNPLPASYIAIVYQVIS